MIQEMDDDLDDGFLSDDDEETREMIRSAEGGEWVSVTDKNLIQEFVDAAHNTPISRKSITLKLRTPTYNRLRTIAAQEGVPYQTLMNSVLKKYTEGRLVEKK